MDQYKHIGYDIIFNFFFSRSNPWNMPRSSTLLGIYSNGILILKQPYQILWFWLVVEWWSQQRHAKYINRERQQRNYVSLIKLQITKFNEIFWYNKERCSPNWIHYNYENFLALVSMASRINIYRCSPIVASAAIT